ncbi:hypothetical protein K469DRAFT_558614, partial [Zopfia rhizophila CBS 207.26]
KSRVCRVYTKIYKKNKYLFLTIILAISLTEYIKISFNNILKYLFYFKNYKSYRLHLSPVIKRFFKTIAIEYSFFKTSSYLSFI